MQRIINHLNYSFTIADSTHMDNPDTSPGSVVLWAFSAWFKVNNCPWKRLTGISTSSFAAAILAFKEKEDLKEYLKKFGYNQ